MPRPKQSAEDAVTKLEAAFWEMLAEMPYSEITVRALARKAGVNHNSIYYHFEGIDQMAAKLLERTMDARTCELFIGAISNAAVGDMLASEAGAEAFSRVRLLAASDSSYLRGLLHQRMVDAWLTHFGISEDELTAEERIDLRFIFAGVTELMGDESLQPLNTQIQGLLTRNLGVGIRKTAANILARRS